MALFLKAAQDSGGPTQPVLHFYTAVIRPVLEYAAHTTLFTNLVVQHREKKRTCVGLASRH